MRTNRNTVRIARFQGTDQDSPSSLDADSDHGFSSYPHTTIQHYQTETVPRRVEQSYYGTRSNAEEDLDDDTEEYGGHEDAEVEQRDKSNGSHEEEQQQHQGQDENHEELEENQHYQANHDDEDQNEANENEEAEAEAEREVEAEMNENENENEHESEHRNKNENQYQESDPHEKDNEANDMVDAHNESTDKGQSNDQHETEAEHDATKDEPPTKLFVGQLHDCPEPELRKFFEGYGEVVALKIKGTFGFVDFKRHEDAIRALEEAHGMELCGSRIRLEFSRPKHPDILNLDRDVCRRCGEKGHWEKGCPNKPKFGAFRDRQGYRAETSKDEPPRLPRDGRYVKDAAPYSSDRRDPYVQPKGSSRDVRDYLDSRESRDRRGYPEVRDYRDYYPSRGDLPPRDYRDYRAERDYRDRRDDRAYRSMADPRDGRPPYDSRYDRPRDDDRYPPRDYDFDRYDYDRRPSDRRDGDRDLVRAPDYRGSRYEYDAYRGPAGAPYDRRPDEVGSRHRERSPRGSYPRREVSPPRKALDGRERESSRSYRDGDRRDYNRPAAPLAKPPSSAPSSADRDRPYGSRY